MLNWIGILLGAAVAFLAIKIGLYQAWALLFNVIISIYLAVFTAPVVTSISAVADLPCCNALAMTAIAVVCFAVLQWLSHTFITSQFSIPFPKAFDVLAAGLLGFFAGFLVWSFAVVLIGITPIAQNTSAKEMGLGNNQANVSFVCWWCNLINDIVSSDDDGYSTQEAIDRLFKSASENGKAGEPNEPNQPGSPKTWINGSKKTADPWYDVNSGDI